MVNGDTVEQRVPGHDLARMNRLGEFKGCGCRPRTNNQHQKGVLVMGISTELRGTPDRYQVMVPGGSMGVRGSVNSFRFPVSHGSRDRKNAATRCPAEMRQNRGCLGMV